MTPGNGRRPDGRSARAPATTDQERAGPRRPPGPAAAADPRQERSSRTEARVQRRQALLDAALVVIRRDGPAASMDAMAAEAGITKPILYRHFGDRRGLVQAAADRFGEDLVTRLAAALGRNEPSRARLAAAIDAYLAFVEEEPGLYRYLTQHAEAAGPALTGVVDRVGALIAREIGEGLRAARADSGAAEPWAYGIVGMIHMAGAQWVARPTLPRQRLVEYLTTLVWDGMGSARPLGP